MVKVELGVKGFIAGAVWTAGLIQSALETLSVEANPSIFSYIET